MNGSTFRSALLPGESEISPILLSSSVDEVVKDAPIEKQQKFSQDSQDKSNSPGAYDPDCPVSFSA